MYACFSLEIELLWKVNALFRIRRCFYVSIYIHMYVYVDSISVRATGRYAYLES